MNSRITLNPTNINLVAAAINRTANQELIFQYNFPQPLGYSRIDYEKATDMVPYAGIATSLTCEKDGLSLFSKQYPGGDFSEIGTIAKLGDTVFIDDDKIVIVRNPTNTDPASNGKSPAMIAFDLVAKKATSSLEATA